MRLVDVALPVFLSIEHNSNYNDDNKQDSKNGNHCNRYFILVNSCCMNRRCWSLKRND